MTVLIETEGVKRHFSSLSWMQRLLRAKGNSVKAVDGVSLSIAKGEIVGLVGESGCGKTTLGWLLAGLEQPDEGAVRFRNRSLRRISSDTRNKIQLLFQNPKESLNPRKDIRSILSYPIQKMGYKTREQINARIQDLLEMVGLSAHYADRYSFQLSGGELQRVALARALMTNTEILILDEATSSLDSISESFIQRALEEMHNKRTVVVVAHRLSTS